MQLKNKSLTGFLWVFMDQIGGQLIGFIVSIFLARILAPNDFGLIAMTTLFVNIGNTLMDSGLTSSLIRSKNIGQRDYSTVFILNVLLGITIYFGLFFLSSYISEFYSSPLLEQILKVYTLTFIINSLYAVQKAILVKEMKFKYQLKITLPSIILAGILGVYLAINGWGVWALVYMYISKSIIEGILYWVLIGWRPSLQFDMFAAKVHLKYGINICVSSLIHVIYTDMYNLFIGRIYNTSILGFYYRANSTKTLIVNNLSSALDKVLFPVFSEVQDDDKRLKGIYKRVMQQVFFWICPILTFCIIMAEPIFVLLFSEKWLPAVPYFQILCIVGILTPIQTYNVNILKVKGRSDLVLKLEYIKKPIFIIGILIFVRYGIIALIWNHVFSNLIGLVINSFYSGKMIKYPLKEQLVDLSKTIINTLFVGMASYYLLKMFEDNTLPIFQIISVLVFSSISYFLLSSFTKNAPFFEFKAIISKVLK